jgi:S1-C subfamily serine protease
MRQKIPMKFLIVLLLALWPWQEARSGYLGIDYVEKGGNIVLTKVDKGSPAAVYGLKPGDTILLMGQPADEFIAGIRAAPPGTIVTFLVLEKDAKERMTLHVPLNSGPGDKVRDDVMQAD